MAVLARLLPAIAAGSLVVGHEVAYRIDAWLGGGARHHVEHGYLSVVAVLVVPLAAAALAWLVFPARGRRVPLPRASAFAVAHVVLFAVQELAERLLGGVSPEVALADSVIWWGVLAQSAVAAALVLVTRAGRALVEATRPRKAPSMPALRSLSRPPRGVAAPAIPASVPGPVGRRAPPFLLV